MENCAICGCELHRNGGYGSPTTEGRSHASEHHFVPERFFGRSKNRPKEKRERLFESSPWGHEGETQVFCYECHEELLHNPVLLPQDVANLAELVRLNGLAEKQKTDRNKQRDRIILFQRAISIGLDTLLAQKR